MYMKLRFPIMMILIVVFCGLFLTANVFGYGEVKKAKEFIEASMFPQAQAILEKEILNSPKNAEAHFLLGICYVHIQRYADADARFISTIGLKSEYGEKIGGIYYKAALVYLNGEKIPEAKAALDKAVYYEPALRKKIAIECLNRGSARLKEGRYINADGYLGLAQLYDPSMVSALAELYYASSQQAKPEDGLNLLKKASQIDRKYEVELGKKYLILANSQELSEKRLAFITEASKYNIPREEILSSSVSYYINNWGHPNAMIDLKDDEFKKAGTIKSGGRIHYLSSTDFWQGNKDVSSNSKLDTQVWNPCYHMIRGKGIRFMTSKDVEVYFKRFKQNTIVYAWIEK